MRNNCHSLKLYRSTFFLCVLCCAILLSSHGFINGLPLPRAPLPPFRGIDQLFAIGPWGLWIGSLGSLLGNKRAHKLLFVNLSTSTSPKAESIRVGDLPAKTDNVTRLIALSDTHGKHGLFEIPDGDVLCHCGDVLLRYGYFGDYGAGKGGVEKFLNWMKEQPYSHKVWIAGNHDTFIQDFGFIDKNPAGPIAYLENNHTVVSGWKIWGSPYSLPTGTSNRAFQYDDETAKNALNMIDDDVDIVMTHSGALGDDVDRKISMRHKPVLWLCGHLHDMYGVPELVSETVKINCASTDMKYRARNYPIVIDIRNSRQRCK